MITSINDTVTLGQLVKATRQSLNITQPVLAMVAGVGLRFVVDLEKGKPTLRLDKVLSVLKALDLDLQVSRR